MWTKAFWKRAAERMIRAGAIVLGLMIGGQQRNVFEMDWKTTIGFVLGGMLGSLIFSLVGSRFNDETSPSFVDGA